MHAPTATPTREAGLAEAHDLGPLTVRVPVTFPPLTAHALIGTPPPTAERKLSRAVLSGQSPEECGVGLRVGDTFLGFQLVEELGQGAFARVFLARQESLAGRPVALKVTLRPTREAERLARLQHTNVVPVYSVHNAPPVQVICMPYLGRRTVADVIRSYRDDNSVREQGGRRTSGTRAARSTNVADSSSDPKSSPARPVAQPIRVVPGDGPHLIGDPTAVLKVLSQLAAGLAHAHARGILHLDLKPANVLLPDGGEPMLLDFNLSFDTTTADRELVGGTVPYMATEQLLDLRTRGRGQIDARTDLYSLGVMAFEMLTGSVPFPASSKDLIDMDGLIEQRCQQPPSVRELNSAVSPAIEAIIHKLLAPEPADRYQSANDLKTDIDRHLADLPLLVAREPSIRERFGKWHRRNPRVGARLTAALLFGLVVGLGAVAYDRHETNARSEAVARASSIRDSLDAVRLDLILPGDAKARARGIARAEEVLASYGLPGNDHWMDRPEMNRLPDHDRAALGTDLGDLLLLVAGAKWQEVESKEASEREAVVADVLRINNAARSCFPAASEPALLARQAMEMMGTPAAPGPEENRTPNPRELFLDAAVAVRSAKYTTALPFLERVVKEQPNHAVAQFCLAYCKEQLGRHDQALERYEVAQSLLPRDVRPAYQRGVILGLRNRHAESEKEYSQVIEMDPEHMLAHRNRGFTRLRQEKYEEAEADLTRALALGAAPIQIHSYRSQARLKRGDKAGAAADNAAADALTPKHEADFVSRGRARLKTDDYRGALADFRSAEALNPRSFSSLVNQLHILADKLHEPEAALAVATRLTRQFPEYGTGRIDRAVILARLGKRTDAHAEAEQALKLSRDPDVTYRAACVYALTSQIVEVDQVKALAFLEQAMKEGFRKEELIQSDPDLGPIRNHERFRKIADAAANLFR
jgi:serine/threonine protein kinase/Tfp pilus assembly protein PilF